MEEEQRNISLLLGEKISGSLMRNKNWQSALGHTPRQRMTGLWHTTELRPVRTKASTTHLWPHCRNTYPRLPELLIFSRENWTLGIYAKWPNFYALAQLLNKPTTTTATTKISVYNEYTLSKLDQAHKPTIHYLWTQGRRAVYSEQERMLTVTSIFKKGYWVKEGITYLF